MKKLAYISWALVMLVCGCQRFEDQIDSCGVDDLTIVQVNEDGSLCVAVTLGVSEMSDVSVDSRASSDFETVINSGWCLIFGEDATEMAKEGTAVYTDNSPLLMKREIELNANGTFLINVNPYDGVAFLRVVVNLSDREEEALEAAQAWGGNEDNYEVRTVDGYSVTYLKEMTAGDFNDDGSCDYGTFGEYKYQSVGLDGIYDFGGYTNGYSTTVDTDSFVKDANDIESYEYDSINENAPDPAKTSDGIPMSSIGFVFNDGITVDSLTEMFMNKIYMVRVCSKLDITVGSSSGFTLEEVYMINCAQEARLRSTVLETSFTDEDDYISMDPEFNIPVDLGGTITYMPLVETVTAGGTTSTPLYFYPNAGGGYEDYNSDAVVNNEINPQYVVLKGRAAGYDTDGYYKIALKARYPLSYNYDADGNITSVDLETAVTYDIIRNIDFNINLIDVDKPGYKTLADAMDDNNPASNISYSITILSEDGRNEILVSNGTYYVELQTTRVYMAGYGLEGVEGSGTYGSVNFSITPSDNNSHPAVYVQSDYAVDLVSCSCTSDSETVELERVDWTDQETFKSYFDSEDEENYDPDLVDTFGDWDTFKAEFIDAVDENIGGVLYKVPSSNSTTDVTVNFFADNSGRIRLRIGDMLKFIPVQYAYDLISNKMTKVSIAGEDDFSYDKADIKYLTLEDVSDTGEGEEETTPIYIEVEDSNSEEGYYSWFSADGYVSANENFVYRELRAMIYPTSGDGITKVYFKQRLSGDVYIYLDSTDYDEYSTDEEAVAYILEMLEMGCDNIIFVGDEGSTYNNGTYGTKDIDDYILSLDAILTLLNAKDSAYTYSVDISEVDCTLDNNSKWKGSSHDYFQGNTSITSVVMPSNLVKTEDKTFYGCSNLQFITFGGVDDPLTTYSSTGTLLEGCSSMIAIVVYTYATSITDIDAMNSSGVEYFTKADNLSADINDDNVVRVQYSNGVLTGDTEVFGYTVKENDTDGNAIYAYIFCTTENLQKYYQYIDADDDTYHFNDDVYIIPYTSDEYVSGYNSGDYTY